MPIYEYVCNACGHEFEEWQKISDAPVQKCPSCGKRKVERLVSLSAFHLKGTGWYVTDYGKRGSSESSGSHGKPAKAESSAGSESRKSESSAGAKSESKTSESKAKD
jgi:putative FmdB family regulatory protein